MLDVVDARNDVSRLGVNRLVDKVEGLDAALVILHQSVTPGVQCIVDGVVDFLSGLRAVVIRIVAYLHLLYIDSGLTEVLYLQITLGFTFSTLCLNNDLGPPACLQGPFAISTITIYLVTGEGDVILNVLVGPSPERTSVLVLRTNFETCDNLDIRRGINLEHILIVVLDNRSLTFSY